MEIVGAISAIVELAHSGLQTRKRSADGVKQVCYPPHPLRTLRTLIIILYPCLQVASEKAELFAALTEYEKAINLKELGDDCDCDCEPILQACAQYEP